MRLTVRIALFMAAAFFANGCRSRSAVHDSGLYSGSASNEKKPGILDAYSFPDGWENLGFSSGKFPLYEDKISDDINGLMGLRQEALVELKAAINKLKIDNNDIGKSFAFTTKDGTKFKYQRLPYHYHASWIVWPADDNKNFEYFTLLQEGSNSQKLDVILGSIKTASLHCHVSGHFRGRCVKIMGMGGNVSLEENLLWASEPPSKTLYLKDAYSMQPGWLYIHDNSGDDQLSDFRFDDLKVNSKTISLDEKIATHADMPPSNVKAFMEKLAKQETTPFESHNFKAQQLQYKNDWIVKPADADSDLEYFTVRVVKQEAKVISLRFGEFLCYVGNEFGHPEKLICSESIDGE